MPELPECLNRRYKLLSKLVGDIRTDLPLGAEPDTEPELSETPVSRPGTPVSGKETPISGKETPVSGKETPVSGKETPVSGKETPVSGKETPVSRPTPPVSSPAPLSPLHPMGSLCKTPVAMASVPPTAMKNDVGIKLMCDFWKILEQDPGCDLKGEVQKRMCKDTCRAKCKKSKGQDDSGCKHSSSYHKEEDKSLQKPHSCCKQSSSHDKQEDKPLQKYHSGCKQSPFYGKEEEKSLQKHHSGCKHFIAHGKEEDKSLQNPHSGCKHSSSHRKEEDKSLQKPHSCCKHSSSAAKGEDKSLQKCLGEVRKAASHEQKCNEKLNELQVIQKDLMKQITLLEDKAAKGTGLLRQADCMWTCMEGTYKNRLADAKENTEFLQTQLKEIESNMNKWKKAQKDVEAELKTVNKCCEDTNVKIIEKGNDLKIIQIEIDGYNKRIQSNAKDLAAARNSYASKKKASDARVQKTKKEMEAFLKRYSEESKINAQKEKQGDASIKDVREDLQKLCKCLLQKRMEKEDLKAETDALVNEVDLLKKACATCKNRCARREKNIVDESKRLDKEIIRHHSKCTKCHKETSSADVTGFCTECPKCQEDRECTKEGDHCELDHAQDCICTRVKQKFLDNVFDNMYTVLEKQVGSCPGKEVADCILHCLKNSRNGKLNEETRGVVQDFVLSAVRQNLNLTIIGGAVKTRCEMDEDTYKQLMLCLKDVTVTQPDKQEKGTEPKKVPCTRWSHSVECHCPSGPKVCPCLKAASRKGSRSSCGSSGPKPSDADKEKQDPSVRFCPRPDPGAGGLDGSTQGRRGETRKQPPCTGGSCCLSPNMRAAQCTLGPDELAYVRSHPSKVPALPSKAPADASKKRDHKKSSSKEHVQISTSKERIPTSNRISLSEHTYPPDKQNYSGIDLTSNELTSTTSLGMSTSNLGLSQSSHTYPSDKHEHSGGVYQTDKSVYFAYYTNMHTYSAKKPAHSSTNPAYPNDKHAYTVDKPAYTVDKLAYTVDKLAYTVEKLAYTIDKPAYTIDKTAYTVDEPAYTVDEPTYTVGEPAYSVDEATYSVDKSAYQVDKPAYLIYKPVYPVDKPVYTVDKPAYTVDEPAHTAEKPAYSVDKPTHPVDKAPYPVDTPNYPVEESKHPVDKPAFPIDKPSCSVDKTSYPVDEQTYPAKETMFLDDGPVQPALKPANLADETVYPVEKSVNKSDGYAYPANELVYPAHDNAYPAEERAHKPDVGTQKADKQRKTLDGRTLDESVPENREYTTNERVQKAEKYPQKPDGRMLDESLPESRAYTTDERVQKTNSYKPDGRTFDVSVAEICLYSTDELAQKAVVGSFFNKPDRYPQKSDGCTLDDNLPESRTYTTDERVQKADRYLQRPDGHTLDKSVPESRAYTTDERVQKADSIPQKSDRYPQNPVGRTLDGSVPESLEYTTDDRAPIADRYSIKRDGRAYSADEPVYPAEDLPYRLEGRSHKADWRSERPDVRMFDGSAAESLEYMTDERVQKANSYPQLESRAYTTDERVQKADRHLQNSDGCMSGKSEPESREYTIDECTQKAERYFQKPDWYPQMPDGRVYEAYEPVSPAEERADKPDGCKQKADGRMLDSNLPKSREYSTDERGQKIDWHPQKADKHPKKPDGRTLDESVLDSREYTSDERVQKADWHPQKADKHSKKPDGLTLEEIELDRRAYTTDKSAQKADRHLRKVVFKTGHDTKPDRSKLDGSALGRRAYTTGERAQKADRYSQKPDIYSQIPDGCAYLSEEPVTQAKERAYRSDGRTQQIDLYTQKADKYPKKPDGRTLDENVLDSRAYTTDEYTSVSEKPSFMTGECTPISEKGSFKTGERAPISEKRLFKTGEHAPISDRRAYTDDERGRTLRRAYTTGERGQTTEKRAHKTGDRANNPERRAYTTGDRVLIPDKRAFKTNEGAFTPERRPYTTSDRVPIPDRRAYKTGERGQTTEVRAYSAGGRASTPEKRSCSTGNCACVNTRRQYKDSSTTAELKKAIICRQDIRGDELVNSCVTETKYQIRECFTDFTENLPKLKGFTDNSDKKENCNKYKSDSVNNCGRSDSFCKGRRANFQKKPKVIQFNVSPLDNASTQAYLHTVSSLQKAIMFNDPQQEKILEEIRKTILKQNESKEQFDIAFKNDKGKASYEFTELTLTPSPKLAIKLSKQTINILEQKSITDPYLDTLSNKLNVILSDNYKLLTSPKIPIEVISDNNESENNKKVPQPQNLNIFDFHINNNKEKRDKCSCKLTSDENLLLQNIKENTITYKRELLKNKEKPSCSCDETNKGSIRNWKSHIPKTLDNSNYKSEFKKLYKQGYIDVAVEIQTENGTVRKLPAVIKKTESGTIAIYARDMLSLNEIRFNGKECPVLLSKTASRTYNVNCGDDSQSCNAILVKTLSDGMLLIPQSVRDQHPFGHIFEVCVMRNQLLELPAVLRPTTSYNYIVVLDKEFEKCFSQTAKEYFGDRFEGSVDLQITSSGNYLLELYNKNESQLKEKKGNAWLVKTSSGNIKIIVRPEFRSIFELELSTSSNSSAQALAQVNNELPSSSKDFQKDNPKKSKNIDNEASIGKLKIKLQDNIPLPYSLPTSILKKKLSDQSAVINKDSKKSLPNSLQSDSLIYDSEKHVSIKHLDSKDIVMKLNSKEDEKTHYGTLKITTSGNFYVEVDDEAVKDLTESSAKSDGLDSLAGTRSKQATQLIDSVHKSVVTYQSKASICNVSCTCGCAEMMFDSRDGSIQNFCPCLRNASVSNENAKKVDSVPIPSTSWDETVVTHIDPSYESFDSQSASHKNVFKSNEQCYRLLQKVFNNEFHNQHVVRPKEKIGSVVNCKPPCKVWDSLSYLPLQLPPFLRNVCCSK